MIPIYAFYADVFWMNQFLLNTAVLFLTGEFYKKTDRHTRIRSAGAAAVGGVLGIIVLLVFQSYYVFLGVQYLLVLPLMMLLTFGRDSIRTFLKRYTASFAAAVLLGGLVHALENVAGIAQIPFLGCICGFLIAEGLIRQSVRQRQLQRLLIPVSLTHRGRCISCLGLMDTGNLLHEPYAGRPVHMLCTSVMSELPMERNDFLGLVPCQTISAADGLLEIYQIEKLCITRDGQMHQIDSAVIARAQKELFRGKEYGIILNSEVCS